MPPMSSQPPAEIVGGNPRLQRLILRAGAAVSLLALPGVIAPRLAVEKLSWLMGFGQPRETPLLIYMTAGGSCVCVAVAALLWVMSMDVARQRPLVLATAWICLACGPLFLWIDSDAGLPGWWVAMDTLACLAFGAALLWACYSCGRQPGQWRDSRRSR